MSHQLKVTLEGVEPPVWRQLVVPSQFTLFDLHCVIQVAMGWENSHLHDFTIKRQKYSVEGPEDFGDALFEDEARLCDVVGPRSKFRYQYDFGDCWDHVIVVEKVRDDESPPVCIDGARACPPEDSGGAWGYSEKLKALKSPDEEESAEMREWLGDDFDPNRFDKEAVNRALARLFRPATAKTKRTTRRK
jgi:Plasmid pRiA4b ORF-3-like protein